MPRSKPYDTIAPVYRDIMKHVDYEGWAYYIHNLADDFCLENGKWLEIAAGDCSLSGHLKKMDPALDITVCDLSFPLLKSSNNDIPAVCCDMRSLPFKGPFVFVYALFDSINYLTEKNDVMKFFSEIERIMIPESIFTFDASMEKNSYRCLKDLNRKGKYNGYRYSQQSRYDSTTRQHRNIFEVKTPAGEEITEEHIQNIYPLSFYYDALEESGLELIEDFNAFTYDPVPGDPERVQFITGIEL